MEPITILGVPIHNLTYKEAFTHIEKMIRINNPHQIVTVNPEFLVIAKKDRHFREVLLNADLALADGVGLQWGAILQKKHFVTRIPGAELTERIMPVANEKKWSIFLLGARSNVAEKAADKLKLKYPELKIDFDNADPTPDGTKKALQHIKKIKPDILLVAYGAPAQDLWIARHKSELNVPVMMGVGGTLDFLAGVSPRPPKILHKLGLEWSYRLIREPWRWKRQLHIPLFIYMVITERFKRIIN